VRLTGGTGAGQSRTIASYSASSGIATVSPAWTTPPDGTTTYVIVENLLATDGFSLHERGANCATAPAALKRKFVSNIFYIRDYADTAGDGIPTLVRSEFDLSGTPPALAHQAAVALVPGIERFAVELGVDNSVARCGLNTAVDYTKPVAKVDPASCAVNNLDSSLNTLPTNRGDGNPDQFIRCTAASCTPAQLANVVAVKLYVLVRNTETSAGYTDTKTYCMSSLDASGSCPTASVFRPPSGDHYKRHMFTTTVRLTTVSGRRETQ
jgi:type IV pilus assembly protein PilW